MKALQIGFTLATLINSSCASVGQFSNRYSNQYNNQFGKQIEKIESDRAAAKGMVYGEGIDKPIVSGTEVSANLPEAKSAVLLLITRGSNLHACTGVFVKQKVLLTAAHCVAGVQATNVRIVFHTHGSSMDHANDQHPAKIRIHEKYDGTPECHADLALLNLSSLPPAGYEPVKLHLDKEKITTDEILLLGYGITDETKKDSMILRQVKKSFKNDIHWKDIYFGIDQKSASGGFCRGDSGAPVFVMVGKERRLLGINSFTVGLEKDRECHTASVAMSAAHFNSWIEKNAKAH